MAGFKKYLGNPKLAYAEVLDQALNTVPLNDNDRLTRGSRSDYIEGQFNFKRIYNDAILDANDGDIFLELGSWLGKSTCYMAERIRDSKKNVTFHAVDNFLGEDMASLDEELLKHTEISIYDIFVKNMKNAGIYQLITDHKLNTHEAAGLFEDETLKFVFIDANHEYEFVKRDIELYYPKVKSGGTIAGHDTQSEGVKKAIDEFFAKQSEDISYYKNSWIHKKK